MAVALLAGQVTPRLIDGKVMFWPGQMSAPHQPVYCIIVAQRTLTGG